MGLELEQSTLQALFNPQEFRDFSGIISEVCARHPDVQGVVITGSLTQRLRLPEPPDGHFENPYQEAYSLIERPGRRRIFPSATSDLDVWVCLKDPDDIGDVKLALETRAIELIKWLADHQGLYPTAEWALLKQQAFDAFYKQAYMYSHVWNELNPQYPWRGGHLKREIIRELQGSMPSLIARINHHFTKGIPGQFIELRALPASTFNLRPDENIIDGVEDKSPFPRIIERLLDMDRNCFVLFISNTGQEEMIYPFNMDGERLGQGILDFITTPQD